MPTAECDQCPKTFKKPSQRAARFALSMHVGRVHSKSITRVGEVLHPRNGNGHEHTEHSHNYDKRTLGKRYSLEEREKWVCRWKDSKLGMMSFLKTVSGEHPDGASIYQWHHSLKEQALKESSKRSVNQSVQVKQPVQADSSVTVQGQIPKIDLGQVETEIQYHFANVVTHALALGMALVKRNS